MKVKENVKKISVIFIGLIAVLLILEIALRIIGYVHIKRTEDKKTVDKDDYVILCVGDSFTEGMGAPKGKSYPEQLEDILNSRIKSKDFKVINKGLSSSTTAMLLEQFDVFLEEINPRVVILLIGWANYWNFYGFREYLENRTFLSKLQNFLYRIRIYKLIKLWVFNVREGKSKNDYKHNVENIERRYNVDTKQIERFTNLANFYKSKGEYEKAIGFYEKVLEEDSNNQNAISELAILYSHDVKKYHYEKNKIESVLKKAIRLRPDLLINYQIFMGLCRVNKNFCKRNLKFLQEVKSQNPVVKDIIRFINESKDAKQEVKNWIVADVKKIIKMCNNRNIKVILHSYPLKDFKDYYMLIVNIILKIVSKECKAPFAEHNRVFQAMKAEGLNIDDYFALDDHCNAKGYRVMAENIYNKIIEENLIDLN